MIWTIRNKNNEVMYEVEAETFLKAIEKNKADLSRANLSGANLSGANLYGADLSYADLSHADLSHTDLSRANLSGANLSHADLYGAKLSHTDLSGADLSHADLSHADLSRAKLSHTDLSRANLSGANLSHANLSHTKLSHTKLSHTKLYGANLSHAKLSGADLKDLIISTSVTSLLQSIDWGILSDALTLEMMAHDAESCGIEKMDEWAKNNIEHQSNKCPFNGRVRDYQFQENSRLWYNAKQKDKVPKLRGMKLLIALCNEKGIKTEGVE